MRRYNLVSGILLILSIVDFALAAPVSAQEKHQEIANVVDAPTEDAINVLGKRWEEDLGKLGEDFLKTGGKPVESSSSAPSVLDNHGSTNVAQPPAAPNPTPSATNPDPSNDPSRSGCSWKRSPWTRGNCLAAVIDADSWLDPNLDGKGANEDGEMSFYRRPQYTPAGPGGLGMGLGMTTPLRMLPQRIPKPQPPAKADADFDWNFWANAPDPPPKPPPREFGDFHWSKVDPAHPPSTSGYGPSPPLSMPKENEVVTPPSAAPDLEPQKEPEDFHWRKVDPAHPPSTSGYGPSPPLSMPKENEAVTQPSAAPDLEPQKEPKDEVVNEAPPSLDPEPHLDPQPIDPQATAIYAAKGKAKESRRIHGTAGDVGNAVQRELLPAERSLDSGE